MADLQVRTYDPKLIIITFGAIIFTGFAEGTFVTITPTSGPAFEKSRGADGGVDRVNKNSNDYTVVVTLKKTSPTNLALSLVLQADKLSNQGKFPLLVKDLNGTSLFAAGIAWVMDDPAQEYSDTMPTREWSIDTGIALNSVGGNS